MAQTNAVIDISHHNGIINLNNAQQADMIGVLQKATQGSSYSDPTYQNHLQQVESLGLLWGAYHFGTGDDGIAQADFFLGTVQPTAGTLLVLDFESNTAGSTMSLQEARDFVTHIRAVTGIWPGLCLWFAKIQSGATSDRSNDAVDRIIRRFFLTARLAETAILG
jgi:lysozyme